MSYFQCRDGPFEIQFYLSDFSWDFRCFFLVSICVHATFVKVRSSKEVNIDVHQEANSEGQNTKTAHFLTPFKVC